MATPTLRALRAFWPSAAITAMLKPSMHGLGHALPAIDGYCEPGWNTQHPGRGKHDLALLLPNSFRSAWQVFRSRIPVRVGYRRDGRGPLLTAAIAPPDRLANGAPLSTARQYLHLAAALGADPDDATLHLEVNPRTLEAARGVLTDAKVHGPFVLLNPGAVRPTKRWPATRFAELADRLAADGLQVAVTGSPAERAVLDEIQAHAKASIADLPKAGLRLADLPAITSLARVLITNDTGPRHVAAAVNTPVVSLFGPTDPAWTVIDFAAERQCVAGGPRQSGEPVLSSKNEVPGREMHRIAVDEVHQAAHELLALDLRTVNPLDPIRVATPTEPVA